MSDADSPGLVGICPAIQRKFDLRTGGMVDVVALSESFLANQGRPCIRATIVFPPKVDALAPVNIPAQFCERSTAAKKSFQKPADCHGSLLRLGTHPRQNRTRDAHKISPHGTMTKRQP